MLAGEENLSAEARGRDLINGMPRTINLTTQDTVTALKDSVGKIADTVRKVLEQGPPELISDVIQRGIVITGGGAKLKNLDVLLQRLTSVPVFVADEPEDCVVLGTGKALDMIDALEDVRNKRSLQSY
jgi:rod shape-determining protein MreB and related proteins